MKVLTLNSRPVCLIRWFLPIVIFLMAAFGCNQGNKSPKHFVEAQFNVDSSLLSTDALENSTLQFSLHPPRLWNGISQEFASSLSSGMLIEEYTKASLLDGFVYEVDSSMMMVLDITAMDPSFFSSLRTDYTELLNPRGQWSRLQHDGFVHGSWYIDQYVMQDPVLLHFKLIVYRFSMGKISAPMLELLYFINTENMEDHIPSVESSIGSLRHFNH